MFDRKAHYSGVNVSYGQSYERVVIILVWLHCMKFNRVLFIRWRDKNGYIFIFRLVHNFDETIFCFNFDLKWWIDAVLHTIGKCWNRSSHLHSSYFGSEIDISPDFPFGLHVSKVTVISRFFFVMNSQISCHWKSLIIRAIEYCVERGSMSRIWVLFNPNWCNKTECYYGFPTLFVFCLKFCCFKLKKKNHNLLQSKHAPHHLISYNEQNVVSIVNSSVLRHITCCAAYIIPNVCSYFKRENRQEYVNSINSIQPARMSSSCILFPAFAFNHRKFISPAAFHHPVKAHHYWYINMHNISAFGAVRESLFGFNLCQYLSIFWQ